jgi:hypothetical protein
MQKMRFNVLVCIGLLFITSTVFLVPHNVHAQELEEDVNGALVPKHEQDEPRKDDDLEGLEATGTDPEPDGWFCHFSMHGDNVHYSGSDVSGHGWWENDDCNATQAVVTVQLQQCINGSWVDAGSPGSKTVYSGGGSANRAVGRARCNSSTWTAWRSEIDVDLIGIPDTPSKYYTSTINLYCRH